MLTNFEKVREFHNIFGLTVQDKPAWPHTDVWKLRKDLIEEEYKEVIDALDNHELPEIAKELADLLYVVYGTGVSFGIDLDKVFQEVHRSNMSKLTKDGEVLRRADGKILKSDQYSPADVRNILEF